MPAAIHWLQAQVLVVASVPLEADCPLHQPASGVPKPLPPWQKNIHDPSSPHVLVLENYTVSLAERKWF